MPFLLLLVAVLAQSPTPSIGVQVGDVSKFKTELTKSPSLKKQASKLQEAGVFVGDALPRGPAYEAGIRRYDVISKVNGKVVKNVEEFTEAIHGTEQGEPIRITVKTLASWWKTVKEVKVTPLPQTQIEILADACPVDLVPKIGINKIGDPEAVIDTTNHTGERIVAITIRVHCFDNFDDPVTFRGDNSIDFICQRIIDPGATITIRGALTFRETTTKLRANVVRLKLENGQEWPGDVNSIYRKKK